MNIYYILDLQYWTLTVANILPQSYIGKRNMCSFFIYCPFLIHQLIDNKYQTNLSFSCFVFEILFKFKVTVKIIKSYNYSG